jgi:hypothetical protein
MKNMEEAMMVADYSQGDHKMKFNDKENNRGDTPNLEESNVKTKEECKQDDDNKKALRDTDYGMSLCKNVCFISRTLLYFTKSIKDCKLLRFDVKYYRLMSLL